MPRAPRLRRNFPFRNIFKQFLREYAFCATYWYVPKARSLRGKGSLDAVKHTLTIIFEKFSERVWNQNTQDDLLKLLIEKEVLEPYKTDGSQTDRTALTRIHKILWEVLGLVWVKANHTIIVTDAGLDVVARAKARGDITPIIEEQIAKWQYPNPIFPRLVGFKGIIPHLFILQLLQHFNYIITREEFNLFVNLAQSHGDLKRIIRYMKTWRDLEGNCRKELVKIVKKIPFAHAPVKQRELFREEEIRSKRRRAMRYNKISLDSAYQRAFLTFPRYLNSEEGNIKCTDKTWVDQIVNEQVKDLKISNFENKEDWFAYYGDPKQQPSWFNYAYLAIERARSTNEAKEIAEEYQAKLDQEEEEKEEIEQKRIEKAIEEFYINNLSQIEPGLKLFKQGKKKGRQYSTPIGPIDILCQDENGMFVVIEIKAREAKDSVFGQILRYIGWVNRNLAKDSTKVRGIIIAGEFPDKARYSKIGLEPLSGNYKKFLRFKKHGLNLQDI